MATLSIIGIFILIIGWLLQHINNMRINSREKLESIYDKMLLVITKNRLPITRDLKAFLRKHKTFLDNPELLEIDVIMSFYLVYEQMKRDGVAAEFKTRKFQLPKELIDLTYQFDKELKHIVVLGGVLNFRFLRHSIYYIAKSLIKSKASDASGVIMQKLYILQNALDNEINIAASVINSKRQQEATC